MKTRIEKTVNHFKKGVGHIKTAYKVATGKVKRAAKEANENRAGVAMTTFLIASLGVLFTKGLMAYLVFMAGGTFLITYAGQVYQHFKGQRFTPYEDITSQLLLTI